MMMMTGVKRDEKIGEGIKRIFYAGHANFGPVGGFTKMKKNQADMNQISK